MQRCALLYDLALNVWDTAFGNHPIRFSRAMFIRSTTRSFDNFPFRIDHDLDGQICRLPIIGRKMLPGTVTIKKERLRRRRYRCENDPTGDIAKRAYCRYQSLVLYLLVQRG